MKLVNCIQTIFMGNYAHNLLILLPSPVQSTYLL